MTRREPIQPYRCGNLANRFHALSRASDTILSRETIYPHIAMAVDRNKRPLSTTEFRNALKRQGERELYLRT
jgi:hypothetical protein